MCTGSGKTSNAETVATSENTLEHLHESEAVGLPRLLVSRLQSKLYSY